MANKFEYKGRIFEKFKKDNRLIVRLKPEEVATMESLRIRWQLGTFSAVTHRLIAISGHLAEEKDRLVREQEDLAKKLHI